MKKRGVLVVVLLSVFLLYASFVFSWVTLNSPSNAVVSYQNNVTLNYTLEATGPALANCTLYWDVNGSYVANMTDYNITAGSTSTNLTLDLTAHGINAGVYQWNINCSNATVTNTSVTNSQFMLSQQRVNITFNEFIYQNTTYEFNPGDGENRTFWYLNGSINITNPGDDTLYDIYVTVSDTIRLMSVFTHVGGRNATHYSGSYPNDVVIHVPELRSGESSILSYVVNGSDFTTPLNIETSYLPGAIQKVLAGKNFTINTSILNNITNLGLDSNLPIYDINITMDAFNATWVVPSYNYNFTFAALTAVGDYGNVTQQDTMHWWWEPQGGIMNSGDLAYLTYNVTAPDVEISNTYPAVLFTLNYKINDIVSNMSITQVNASAQALFNFTKQVVDVDEQVFDHNATFETTPYVYTVKNIAFNLTKNSQWVTATLNPNNRTGNDNNLTLGVQLDPLNPWTTTGWQFNFTDGYNDSYPAPIIWMKPEFTMLEGYGQFVNASLTRNGEDYYIDYIFIVAGYWLEVKKNVTNVAQDQYNITIWVHNKGSAPTPANMTVTVYDFVPQNFTAFDFNPTPTANETLSAGEFQGVAYKWDIGATYAGNHSLAEDDGVLGGNDEWTATYVVNGTGTYRISDLYIVGLDPRQVDGASSSPFIRITSGVLSVFVESFYIIASLLLIGLIIVSFIVRPTDILVRSDSTSAHTLGHDKHGSAFMAEAVEVKEASEPVVTHSPVQIQTDSEMQRDSVTVESSSESMRTIPIDRHEELRNKIKELQERLD